MTGRASYPRPTVGTMGRRCEYCCSSYALRSFLTCASATYMSWPCARHTAESDPRLYAGADATCSTHKPNFLGAQELPETFGARSMQSTAIHHRHAFSSELSLAPLRSCAGGVHVRTSIILLFISVMARVASSCAEKFTNPKPFDLPVSSCSNVLDLVGTSSPGSLKQPAFSTYRQSHVSESSIKCLSQAAKMT